MNYFVISDIKLPYTASDADITAEAARRARKAGISVKGECFSVFKKSLDARNKSAIVYVSSVLLKTEAECCADKLQKYKISAVTDPFGELSFRKGSEKAEGNPLVVGMGPCGLFAALLLAIHGYRPTIIDRGGSVFDRAAAVEGFYRTGKLDTESNIQFGAGGAGTFSDGKLVTRIKDSACSYVLKTFVLHGADESILSSAKPHIGTDVLRGVVDSILSRIEALGGKVIYNCKLLSITESSDYCVAHTSKGDITCSSIVLAVGHSSRDTYEYLMKCSYPIVPKSFSVGVRVEHLREDVDRSLYGDFAGDPRLPVGEYAVSDTRGERGVYTFCMCPGGYVMAATSEEEAVVTNGMSEFARDGKNSNSAMLVSVSPDDFGSDVRRAIAFQRQLERDAFSLGGKDYFAPILTVGDLLDKKCKTEPTKVLPTYMNGKVRCAPLYSAMPDFLYEGLVRGFKSFERKLACFGDMTAVITGFETRTSAPLRILRTDAMTVPGHERIYPCGEGAGYAGGITSAACDGIHAAEKIIGRFAPKE